MTAAFLLLAVLASATLSGVFGMAGGLLLMGALAFTLPVAAAFVVHGLLQLVSNGWRAWLHRAHVKWAIVARYAVGTAIAGGAVALVSFVPSRPLLFLLLGLVPLLAWVPGDRLRLDARRPEHAVASGFLVTALNLLAGVAGPLLDTFFVRTAIGRHAIVATKAATQVFAHLAKVVVYGMPMLGGGGALPSPWFFAAAVPLSMLGTALGGRLLERITDRSFLRWTRWIVTAIGAGYLVQAARLAVG